jgi:hypothetical protein
MKPLREWVSIILAAASLLGFLWIESTHNDVANATRVATLEAHRVDDHEKLNHIEMQVDRLVEWAFGHK